MAEDSLGGLASLASPVGLALGATQVGLGLLQSLGGNKRMKRLQSQRKAYQTPDEIYDILNATENNMQGDTQVRDFLTNQIDQTFSSSISAGTRLGADANSLSALFGQKVNSLMKVGVDQHQQNMANYGQYLNALGLVSDNKAAEQKSREDILKDQLQSASAEKQQGIQNVGSGANAILGTLSAAAIGDLYNPDGTKKVKSDDILQGRVGGIPNMTTTSSRSLNY